jgi:hypothetical protein
MEKPVIPATHPFEARFKQSSRPNGEGTAYFTTMPVIAWDEEGLPLVLDKQRLMPASSWSNFHDVVEAASPIVAVIPGNGWMAEYQDGEETSTSPILAWTVDTAGEFKPIAVDGDGCPFEADEVSNLTRIYDPERDAES